MRQATVVLVLCLLGFVCARNPTEQEKFVKRLLADYDARVSPLDPTIKNVTVNMTLQVTGASPVIMGSSEDMRIVGFLDLYWTDPRLQYADFNRANFKNIRVPVDSVWTPDITLLNWAPSAIDMQLLPNSFNPVSIDPSGVVSWTSQIMVVVTCDNQNDTMHWKCPVEFGSTTYDATELDLQTNQTSFDDDYRSKSWKLSDADVTRTLYTEEGCENPFVSMNYMLEFDMPPEPINSTNSR